MMQVSDIVNAHKEKSQSASAKSSGLRRQCYQDHYKLIKESVKAGIPLLSAIKIIRQRSIAESNPDPFGDTSNEAVWQAFRSALLKEGISLTHQEMLADKKP